MLIRELEKLAARVAGSEGDLQAAATAATFGDAWRERGEAVVEGFESTNLSRRADKKILSRLTQ